MEKNDFNPKQILVGNTDNLTTPKSWNNIEPEMLIKIFAQLHSPTNPKEMASRRLVCKHWRNVIDEHFEFRLTVNDTRMDLVKVSHLRVNNCTIVNLTNEVDSQTQLFRSPKSLSVWGEISPLNFHRIIQQAVNMKHLSFNCIPLTTRGFMDNLVPDSEERAQEFWNGLSTLEISMKNPYKGTALTDNLCKILSKSMQNLSSLKMRIVVEAEELETFISALYSFLGKESNQNLKTFHFNWFFNAGRIPPPKSALPLLGDLQLESLRLSLKRVEFVPYWIPVMQAQRKLKDFRFTLSNDVCDRLDFPQNARFHQVLESLLELNQQTLETVELTQFNLTDYELDGKIFRGMEKLSRLVVRPCQFLGRHQRFLNLGFLPGSIETLVFGKVSVNSDELKLLVDRLDNIKVVEIIGTKTRGEFVMPEIFEMLTKKENIRKITVNPLDERFPRVSRNGKKFVIVNGYEMQVLLKNFVESINFTFP